MAQGLFVTGFSIAEVLAIQAKAKAMVMEGKTILNYSDSGTSVGKAFTLPVREVLDECAHALRVLDPTTYGRSISGYRVNFGGGVM